MLKNMKVLDLVNDIAGSLFKHYLYIYTEPAETKRDQMIQNVILVLL